MPITLATTVMVRNKKKVACFLIVLLQVVVVVVVSWFEHVALLAVYVYVYGSGKALSYARQMLLQLWSF